MHDNAEKNFLYMYLYFTVTSFSRSGFKNFFILNYLEHFILSSKFANREFISLVF